MHPKTGLISLFFLVILSVSTATYIIHGKDYRYGSFGTLDFIQYWSAYRIAQDGDNPYDPAEMSPVQREAGNSAEQPFMMWVPPWTLLILSPILELDFAHSAMAFMLLNFALFVAGAFLAAALLQNERRSLSENARFWSISLLACFCLMPPWACLLWGQLGLLLTFFLCAAFLAIEKKQDVLAGLLLIPLTLKPHLFYLVAVALFWWVVANNRWRIVASFLLCLLITLLLTTSAFPGALQYWIDSFADNADGAVRKGDWMVSTGTGMFRVLVEKITGNYPLWPQVVMPFVCFCATALFLLIRRPIIHWGTFLPPLMAISLFTAPYGWVQDQALLIPLQVLIVHYLFQPTASTKTRVSTAFALILFFLLPLALSQTVLTDQHHFFWIPIPYLALWFTLRNKIPA